jgi:hypothetical protein
MIFSDFLGLGFQHTNKNTNIFSGVVEILFSACGCRAW